MSSAKICGALLPLAISLALVCPAPLFAAPTKTDAPTLKSTGNAASIELNEKAVKAVQQHDFAKAEALFRKSLAADPRNLTAAYNLAGVYLNNKRQKEALALLNQYIKDFSKDPGLYARRGDVHFSLKDTSAAAKDYEQAIKLEPQYPGLSAKLATIYTLQKRMPDAEKMMLTAVEQEPKNGQLLQNLSALFLVNGKPNESISAAKRALQVSPNADIYITLGNAYEALGDTKNSLISFQRASDLGSTKPELKAKIDELKKVAS